MPNPNVSRASSPYTTFFPSFIGGGVGVVRLSNSSRLVHAEVKVPPPRRAKTGGFWHEIKKLFNYGVNFVSAKVEEDYATRVINSSAEKLMESLVLSIKSGNNGSVIGCLVEFKLQVAGIYDKDLFRKTVFNIISKLDSSVCAKIKSEISALIAENGANFILNEILDCISVREIQKNILLGSIDQILKIPCKEPDVGRADFLLEKVKNFNGFQRCGICASEIADYVFKSGKLELYELNYLCEPEKHQVPLKDRPENWGVLLYEKAKVRQAEEVKDNITKNVSEILKTLKDEGSVNFWAVASANISSKVIEIARIANSLSDLSCLNINDLVSDFFLFNVSAADRGKCKDILQRKLIIEGSNLGREIESQIHYDVEAELKNGKKRFDFNPMRIANPVNPSNVFTSLFNAIG